MEHFSLSLLGFNRRQVTEKIEAYQEKISNLEKDLEVLQAKFETLDQEVRNYRGMEEALQEGILDARLAGHKIVDESSQEAQKILDKTHEKVSQYREDFAFHSRELVESGSYLKDNLKIMKTEFQKILDAYQDMLDGTDFEQIYPKKHIDRLLMQIEAYEEDDEISGGLFVEPVLGANQEVISEEEKFELEQLINEVISNEPQEDVDSDKFIDFSKIKHSQEG